MKALTNVQRATQYMNRIFKAINEEYFNGELETPTITIQSTVAAYGHISVDKVWKTEDGRETYELNIAAEYLSRPIENVVATMIHEASHLYNLMHGIQDCKNNYYHNKKFKKVAEEMGHLQIDQDPRYGWTITSPTEDTLNFIIEYGFEDIQIHRETPIAFKGIGGTAGNGGTPTPTTAKPKGSHSIKWICPVCGNIARTTKVMNLVCGDCMEKMVMG